MSFGHLTCSFLSWSGTSKNLRVFHRIIDNANFLEINFFVSQFVFFFLFQEQSLSKYKHFSFKKLKLLIQITNFPK